MKRKKDSLKKEESRGGGEEVGGNYGPTDREAHFQSEFYSGRQIDRNAVSQSDTQTDIQGRTCTQVDSQSVSLLVRQAGRPTKRETDRQKRPVQSVSQSICQLVNKSDRQSVRYTNRKTGTRTQGKSDKELKKADKPLQS